MKYQIKNIKRTKAWKEAIKAGRAFLFCDECNAEVFKTITNGIVSMERELKKAGVKKGEKFNLK